MFVSIDEDCGIRDGAAKLPFVITDRMKQFIYYGYYTSYMLWTYMLNFSFRMRFGNENFNSMNPMHLKSRLIKRNTL